MEQQAAKNNKPSSLVSSRPMPPSSSSSSISGYWIAGYQVRFPFRPYPSQLAMMEKVLTALSQEQNAMLESPTGSGKTLALLCAALAWQSSMLQKVEQDLQKEEEVAAAEGDGEYAGGGEVLPSLDRNKKQEEMERRRKKQKEKEKRVPTIFYCSRTHGQIAQLVRELRRTSYRPRMTVLASREHYCIHPRISTIPNKNHECKRLNDTTGCKFKHNKKELQRHPSIQPGGHSEVWDIEDLVGLGEEVQGCPYFAAKRMAKQAELVFCPYNHILDVGVRENFHIKLDGNIFIFDEAHNIEDAARGATSIEVDLEDLQEFVQEMYLVLSAATSPTVRAAYTSLHKLFSELEAWFSNAITLLTPKDFENHSNVWRGEEIVGILARNGLTHENFADFNKRMLEVAKHVATLKESEPHLSAKSMIILEGLFRVWKYLLSSTDANNDCANDYKMLIQKTAKRDKRHQRSFWTHRLCFWCMNPAVAFRPIAQAARSVILTSGTLSPSDSFSSELDTSFEVRLEAPHVIDAAKQVWVGAIGEGPQQATMGQPQEPISLHAVFNKVDNLLFQDAIGEAVLQYCRVIPHGVLCFFPSYLLLNKCVARWRATQLWKKLDSIKRILVEPQNKDDGDFDSIISEYYSVIKRSTLVEEERKQKRAEDPLPLRLGGGAPKQRGESGAIFFAVCRGKVSEGLDFSDNNARAVIVIGIPFPSVKEQQIVLKREYNDEHCRYKPLLDGSRWYSLQAWRALNQAVGRCIRHKNDFGAIILLDQRFCQESTVSKLPRWIRNNARQYSSFSDSLTSLKCFFHPSSSSSSSYSSASSAALSSSCLPRNPCSPVSSTSSPSLFDLPSNHSSRSITPPAKRPPPSSSFSSSISSSSSSGDHSAQSQYSIQFSNAQSSSSASSPPKRQKFSSSSSTSSFSASASPSSANTSSPMFLCCNKCGAQVALANVLTRQKQLIHKPYFRLLTKFALQQQQKQQQEDLSLNGNNTNEAYVITPAMLLNENCSALPANDRPDIFPEPSPSSSCSSSSSSSDSSSTSSSSSSSASSSASSSGLSVWAPHDMLAYVPLFCRSCPAAPYPPWLGLVVAAANKNDRHLLKQVWMSAALVHLQSPSSIPPPSLPSSFRE